MEYPCAQTPNEAGPPRRLYFHMDSDQRDKTYVPSDSNNLTNDIVIPVKIPHPRMEVTDISLSMWELPDAVDTVIELESSLFNFSQGFVIDSQTDTIEIKRNGITVFATLPLTINKIIDVDDTIITTEHPHNFPLGKTSLVSIVGSILKPDQLPVDAYAINETTLRLSSKNLPISAPFGYITVPRIPDPMTLAKLLTEQFEPQINVSVNFNACTGYFSICANEQLACSGAKMQSRGLNNCIDSCNPSNNGEFVATTSSSASLVVTRFNGLPGLMGFGFGCVLTIPDGACINGTYGIGCYGTLRMPAFRYQPAQVGATLEYEWNRFYFESTPNETFKFSSYTSVSIQSFDIPNGKYSAFSLAGYIQKQMNLLDPDHPDYEVEYIGTRFCIGASTDFALEFDEDMPLATRIGFDANPHRGSHEYCSDVDVYAPTFRCCNTTVSRSPVSILYTTYVTGTQKVRYRLSAPAHIDIRIHSVDASTHKVIISSANAMGLERFDQVRINGRSLLTLNSDIDNAFRATIEWPDPLPTVGQVMQMEYSQTPPAPLGFLFAPRPGQNQVEGWAFGFPSNCDVFSMTPTASITSESTILTRHLTYLLLVMDEPDATGAGYHFYENGNLINVLAKLQLFPYVRLDRTPTFSVHFAQPKNITHLRLRLLTPEHKLYPLNGLKWSATFEMLLTERRLPMLGCTY